MLYDESTTSRTKRSRDNRMLTTSRHVKLLYNLLYDLSSDKSTTNRSSGVWPTVGAGVLIKLRTFSVLAGLHDKDQHLWWSCVGRGLSHWQGTSLLHVQFCTTVCCSYYIILLAPVVVRIVNFLYDSTPTSLLQCTQQTDRHDNDYMLLNTYFNTIYLYPFCTPFSAVSPLP